MKALFFRANYCPYCNIAEEEVIDPLIDEGYDIDVINAMKKPKLADKYKVKSIPTTVILNGDKVETKIKGKITEEQLRSLLTK